MKLSSVFNNCQNMLKKVTQDNQDVSLAILAWRSISIEGGCYSPVEKLLSRRTHTYTDADCKQIAKTRKPKQNRG